MKIHQIQFARKEFDRIPEAERTLLVMLGHIANDLNVLVRLFHWSALALDATPIEAKANNVIVLTVIRLFTAKLYEAWKLLSQPIAGSALKKWYESELGPEERAALDRLKVYFGRSNLIKEVRHRHSFHYSHEDVTAAYAAVPENEEFEMYLGDSDLNNLYYFAEVITGRALLHAIDPNDHRAAMERFRRETTQVHADIHAVVINMLAVAVQKHLGKTLGDLGNVDVEIDLAFGSEDIKIPFFVRPSESAAQQGVPSDVPASAASAFRQSHR